MAIEFGCPACGTTLRVDDESAGRAVRCGHCMAVVEAPAFAEALPVAEVEPGPPRSVAEPVAPPPRPRPRPRKARRTSTRAWLLGSLLVCGVLFGLCCGGVYLGGQPKWRTHDSEAGGFRVELPAAPRADMAHWAGTKNDPNVKVEGTILFLRLEDYGVIYTDIDAAKRRVMTADAILDEAIAGMAGGLPGARVVRQAPVTVSGFPGREVVIDAPGHGTAVGRVVLAESRLYVVVSGGRFADPDGVRARRFLDSFEITDPQKLADRRKLADDLRRTDERVEAVKRAGAAARQKLEDDERRRAEELAAFETGAYRGRPVPAASDLPGVVLYLTFDEPGGADDRVSGRRVVTFVNGARLGPGVRGTAAYTTPPESAVDASAGAPALRFRADQSFTVAGWYKCWDPEKAHPLVVRSRAPKLGELLLYYSWGALTLYFESHRNGAPGGPQRKLEELGLADRGWHHFAFVRTVTAGGGELVEVFIDGRQAFQASAERATALTNVEILRVGVADGFYQFVGAVDEFCAFDRALSEQEIDYLAGRVAVPTNPDRRPTAPAPRAR
jgi:predicted Zn finger-like uncharacterized protein